MSEEEDGKEGTNIPEALIVFHHSELSKLERDEDDAKAALKTIRDRKKKYRKTVQGDGITLGIFDQVRKDLNRDEDDIRAEMAERGRYLRAFKSDLGQQFDLFEQPGREMLEDQWFGAGYRAGAAGKWDDDNPHRPGDNGHAIWAKGYRKAQEDIARGMEMSKSTAAPEGDDDDPEDDSDEQEAFDTAADPEPAPESEEDALEDVDR